MGRSIWAVTGLCWAWQVHLSSVGFAQRLPFQNYSVSAGLGQSSVRAIAQDHEGYLWFGTNGGGVSKFDGLEFTTYTTEHGLPDNSVQSLLVDRDGRLWIGTRAGGVVSFDGSRFHAVEGWMAVGANSVNCILQDRHGTFWFGTHNGVVRLDHAGITRYTTADGLPHRLVHAAYEDRQGTLWFGTSSGLAKFDGTRFTRYQMADGLAANGVFCIAEDADGRLWVGTFGGGVSRFDGERFVTYTTADGLADNDVRSILVDREGHLWFGTQRGGVTRFDGKQCTSYNARHGLSDNDVRSLLQDREGNLWFGTSGGGVSRLGGEVLSLFTTGHGLASDNVTSIMEDSGGHVWLGTDGGGVSRFDGQSFVTYGTAAGLGHNRVATIFRDRTGALWFGTRGGGVSRLAGERFQTYHPDRSPSGRFTDWVYAIFQDRAGQLLIGTSTGGLGRLEGTTFVPCTIIGAPIRPEVRCMLEDRVGNLWLGTQRSGVIRVFGNTTTVYTTTQGLAHNTVRAIFEDRAGALWISTEGGLSRFDGRRFTNYSTADGLPSSDCRFVVEDGDYLYVGTMRGLCRLDPATSTIMRYSTHDGLASAETNPRAVLRDRHGDLWFGTVGGVLRLRPSLDVSNPVPPPVHITRVWALNRELRNLAGQPLAHDQNHLTFDYVGLSFSMPTLVTYRYQLAGIDEDWRETAARSVSYPRLAPGAYTFRVEARNAGGVPSERPAEVSFVIRPPVWATVWFRCVAAGCLVSLLVALHRGRTRRYKRRNAALEEAVAERTRELVAAKSEVEHARDALENKVVERTAALNQANVRLREEVGERVRTERQLLDQQDQLRSLASQLSMTKERERQSIAADLHDHVTQRLAASKFKLEMVQAAAAADVQHGLAEIIDLIDRTIAETRTLMVGLSDPVLTEMGLEHAVERLVEETRATTGLAITFSDDRQPKPLDFDLRRFLFRSTQELLQNVVKHAQARTVSVSIARDRRTIRITVEDDGVGWSPPGGAAFRMTATGGFGLFSICEGLRGCGGSLQVESPGKRGTRVRVVAPLHREKHPKGEWQA